MDEVVSGRMTPTFPVAFTLLGAGAELPEAEEPLVLQTALTAPAAELPEAEEDPLALLELFDDEPQAATANVATAPSAARDRVDLRMYVRLPMGGDRTRRRRPEYVSTDNILPRPLSARPRYQLVNQR